MIKKYNTKSLIIGTPGLLIQKVGLFGGSPILAVFGTIILVIGLSYYAKAKGYSAFAGLWGILGILGVLNLALHKDRTLTKEEKIKIEEIKKTPLMKSLLQLSVGVGVLIIIFLLLWIFSVYVP